MIIVSGSSLPRIWQTDVSFRKILRNPSKNKPDEEKNRKTNYCDRSYLRIVKFFPRIHKPNESKTLGFKASSFKASNHKHNFSK